MQIIEQLFTQNISFFTPLIRSRQTVILQSKMLYTITFLAFLIFAASIGYSKGQNIASEYIEEITPFEKDLIEITEL